MAQPVPVLSTRQLRRATAVFLTKTTQERIRSATPKSDPTLTLNYLRDRRLSSLGRRWEVDKRW